MFDFNECLIERASSVGIVINSIQAEKFEKYISLMLEWNQKINLTTITEPLEVIDKHIIDSLIPSKIVDFQKGSKIVDVGSGAGFPGIPLKIMYPEIEMTMIDSLNKKVIILKEILDLLCIDANCVHMRAEAAGLDCEFREKFDVAISRAVSKLPILSELCIPLVRRNGLFVAMKGANSEIDLSVEKTFNILGGTLLKTQKFNLPNGDKRTIIIVEKKTQTPSIYPRNSKNIKEKPLV